MNIEKLSSFIEVLTKATPTDKKELFFRGHSNKEFKLTPTLYRKENYHLYEDKIFKDIILSCPQDFHNCKNTIEILVKMQHYGVPTRLLDITRNALVALFFACSTNMDKDGEVIILQIPRFDVCYFDSDKVSILSNIAKQNSSFYFDHNEKFNYKNYSEVENINDEYFGYLLHSIKEEKPHFKDIINPEHIQKVFAVQTKLDNPRIIRQNGAFLIFGCIKIKNEPASVNADWIIKPSNEQIIIPCASKQRILKELDVLGVNNSTLFPELEDQAEYIKNRYNLS